jgi:hypothetical protein
MHPRGTVLCGDWKPHLRKLSVPFDRQRTSLSGNLMRVVEQAPALITLYRKSVELVLLVIGVLRDPLILW